MSPAFLHRTVAPKALPPRLSTGGFDAVRAPLGADLGDYLTAPDPTPLLALRARAELDELAGALLHAGPGALVLRGLPPGEAAGERAVLRVTGLLGTALPQNREGTLLRRVRDRGASIGQRGRVRYSDTRFGGDLHTDGAEAPLPAPDLFTLMCVRQAAVGGALQCVHVRDLTERLAEPVLRTLREPFHFDRRGDQADGSGPTVRKPILFVQRGRPAIGYLRSYIEQGHDHPGVPDLTAAQIEALDALDDAVAACAGTGLNGKLDEGELALFDNLSLLHGRTEFQDDPDHARLLLRTWVRLHPAGEA